MEEVCPRLFVGSQDDCFWRRDGWLVLHGCKEPCHRRALGYTSRGAPRESPGFLRQHYDGGMALNLIDAKDASLIREELLEAAVSFVEESMAEAGKRVLIHCNRGESRAPGLAMLYLVKAGLLPGTLRDAEMAFRRIYRRYAPGEGMREAVGRHMSRWTKVDGGGS